MISDLLFRLRALFRRRSMEQELDEELRTHLEHAVEKYVETGLPLEEARRRARLQFGGIDQIKEECRDARGVSLIDTTLQDVRYSLRLLRKNPGFAATTILTLALGIGATTAVFSVVDNVMLKPLPFPTADRLVRVRSVIAATGHGSVASYPDFLDWRARNDVFDGMAVFRTNDFTLAGAYEPVHLEGAVVSAWLFPLLGVAPAFGRGFLPEEDQPAAAGGADPVILSHGLWQREFHSDAKVLGRSIQLGGHAFTIVGVMPHGFQFPIQGAPVELWTTIAVDSRPGPSMTTQRGAHYLDVVGVLKPGVSIRKAQAEMATIATALSTEHPENKPRSVRIVPEVDGIVGPVRTPLLVLLGAVGCVLLIVCVNIANLLLARATGRYREMAIRAALGASGRRATRQMLTESIVLALFGGTAGLVLALMLVRLLVRMTPAAIPRLNTIGLDGRLLVFSLFTSVLAGVLFGLAPALRASKIALTDSLQARGRTGGSDKVHSRLRSALVVAEVALAALLLPIAGLLIESFVHLVQVNPGFRPQHVLTFQLDVPDGTQVAPFVRDVVAGIRTIPSVASASAVASLPLTGDNIASSIEIEGQPTPLGSRPTTDYNAIEPNYFRTLGIQFIAGRDFTKYDDLNATPVVIVNRTLARRFFPNQNPIGRRIRPGIGNGYAPGTPPLRKIVGVVDDVKQNLSGEAAPEVYAPVAQSPFGTMSVVVRSRNDERTVIAAARRVVRDIDKNVPLYHVESLSDYFARAVAIPQFITVLLSSFAAFALLLACIGVYGVMSYTVAQRTHEIGVRIALGAKPGEILLHWLRRGSLLACLGVTIGLAASFSLAQVLSSLLYGVRAADPLSFAVAPLTLVGVAAVATYFPARRAAKVDPMVALRYE